MSPKLKSSVRPEGTTYQHVRALPPRDRRARKLASVRPAATRATAPSQPQAELFVGRYQLSELLGRGGMGQVWSARDTKSGRDVAIKLVTLDTGDPEVSRGRFEREAALSKQLRGPTFVEFYTHGSFEGGAYAVMELLHGETLQERLRRVQRMTVEETSTLLKGIASGLRVAHALQIVHRDLKPANVFFARIPTASSGVQALDGRRESVRLLDFGIAKDAWDQTRLTRPGMFLGSAHYMSPEQIRSSRDVDTRSDLWSLAVMLFRALTGERPFNGDAADALAKIVNDTPARPSALHPGLPRGLDRFFERALTKDPAERFQTIDELVEAFDRSLSDEASLEQELEDDFAAVLTAIDKLKMDSPVPRPKLSEPPATVVERKRVAPPPLPRMITPAMGTHARYGSRPPPAPQRGRGASKPPAPLATVVIESTKLEPSALRQPAIAITTRAWRHRGVYLGAALVFAAVVAALIVGVLRFTGR